MDTIQPGHLIFIQQIFTENQAWSGILLSTGDKKLHTSDI